MCEIIDIVKRKNLVTGYKVVIKSRGKYYSPSTRVEYIIGEDIPIAPDHSTKTRKSFSYLHYPDKDNCFFDKRHQGCTQIFDKLSSADGLLRAFQDSIIDRKIKLNGRKIIIVKIRGRSKYKGFFSVRGIIQSTVLISNIKSLEEV